MSWLMSWIDLNSAFETFRPVLVTHACPSLRSGSYTPYGASRPATQRRCCSSRRLNSKFSCRRSSRSACSPAWQAAQLLRCLRCPHDLQLPPQSVDQLLRQRNHSVFFPFAFAHAELQASSNRIPRAESTCASAASIDASLPAGVSVATTRILHCSAYLTSLGNSR